MSTLYILLPQSTHLQPLADMIGTLVAGGQPVQAEQVQPVVYGSQPMAPEHLARLTHEWPAWLDGLRSVQPALPVLLPAVGITTHQAQAVSDSVPRWCLPHVMAYEAIAHQLPQAIGADDAMAVLVEDDAQLPWAYAARACFGAFTPRVHCVWQMPPQALAAEGYVSAAYEPQLTALQQLMPVVCTGLRTDAATHGGFTLVESAAALLHAPEAQAAPPDPQAAPLDSQAAPLACMARRGGLQTYGAQHLPFEAAARAMQRVALWQVVGNPHLVQAMQRVHATGGVHAFVQRSPVLRAMAEVRACQQRWMAEATANCFAVCPTPQAIKAVTDSLSHIRQLDATANDAQRHEALLQALTQALPEGEKHFAAPEGSAQPVRYATAAVGFEQVPFHSPTAWVERADHAFARHGHAADDAEAERTRQMVLALWHEFFHEEVDNAPRQLLVKEVRLSSAVNAFTALRHLLPLTEAGRQMLEADIVYEVSLRQSPRVLLAISSPLTGFALCPGADTFTRDDYELHAYDADFVRFVDAYLRMFPDTFPATAFRRYVEREKSLLADEVRSRVEATRPNVMAEFPAFARHVGIEPMP